MSNTTKGSPSARPLSHRPAPSARPPSQRGSHRPPSHRRAAGAPKAKAPASTLPSIADAPVDVSDDFGGAPSASALASSLVRAHTFEPRFSRVRLTSDRPALL